MSVAGCHPDRPHHTRGLCAPCASAAYRLAHRGEDFRLKHRAASRRYTERHRYELRARRATFRKLNPDVDAARRELERVRRYNETPEHRRARLAAAAVWRSAHPERRSLSAARRTARRRGGTGHHTLQEWLDKVELFAGCCVYCGRDDVALTRDHDVPLRRGGTDSIDNVLPACLSCNSRKNNRTAREYLASRRAA